MSDELYDVSLPKRVYDVIETAVVGMYKELGIKNVPIKPIEIAERKGYILKNYSELSPAARIELKTKDRDGVSFYNQELGAFIICYDDVKSYYRKRFTIMHEIGHIVLGHKQESELARKMADYFAAYSLAPSPLIHEYRCEDYMDISNVFDVSPDSAGYSFQRYENWLQYGGDLKLYEIELLNLFS